MKAQKAMLSTAFFILRLSIIILLIVGIYRLGEYSYVYCYSIVSDMAVEEAPGRDVGVSITDGMSPKETAQLLEKKGLVKDAKIFQIQLKVNDYDDALKQGRYVLNTSMTPKQMMSVMAGEQQEEEEK